MWSMHGFCVDFVWSLHGVCMDSGWILYGVCTDCAWIRYEICLDSVGILCRGCLDSDGFCMGSVWFLFGFCWILYQLCMDSIWSLHGFCMDSAWSLCGFCMESILILLGFCTIGFFSVWCLYGFMHQRRSPRQRRSQHPFGTRGPPNLYKIVMPPRIDCAGHCAWIARHCAASTSTPEPKSWICWTWRQALRPRCINMLFPSPRISQWTSPPGGPNRIMFLPVLASSINLQNYSLFAPNR